METITKQKSYDNWLMTEGAEVLQQLITNKQLLENQQDNEYFYYASQFVKSIRTELYGDWMVLKVISKKEFIDNKSERNMLRIEAIVMEPNENRYIECNHPLEPDTFWNVSAVIPRNRIKEIPEDYTLIYAKYDVEKKPEHLKNVVKIDLTSCRSLRESLLDQLSRIGGPLLVEEATEAFGSDFEKNLTEKLLLLYKPLRKKISEERKKIEQNLSVLADKQKQFEDCNESLTEKQKEWQQILSKIDSYIAAEEKREVEETRDSKEYPWIKEEVVDILQSLIYHNSEDDLIYDERVIETFLRAIQTNTLIILSGPSGTGKSSIVTEFARAIKGAKATLVPVQSGWTDTQDLLGYFNPIDQCYVPTPFMEALADAANDPNHLHLICLDEMNLAHIEYYFSEFLSSREKKTPSIRLYSDRYFSIAKKRLKGEHYNSESESFLNASDLIKRYQSNFKIPSNVRFIGTMNMDHTVKSISPKVIDRSFLIEVDHLDKNKKNKIKKKLVEKEQKGCIDVSIRSLNEIFRVEHAFEKEVQEIIDLSHQLESIANAPLNSRGRKHIISYFDRIPEEALKGSVKEKYFDQIIYSKILPRIELSKKNEEGMKVLEDFQQKIDRYKYSSGKLQRMLADERFIRFW
ncbi:AAA domain-containing protein [Planococcus glaciei]|uniref:AAA domain-containing protein n=1 Tax=Planococcus glaciei TaxID=459472 RepID=A0A7H8QAI9_9BACL|nr:AAA family ATPase [Planococcus glaciei]QKX51026.1 AAA domain-containing protein [Planococcus glaciei]